MITAFFTFFCFLPFTLSAQGGKTQFAFTEFGGGLPSSAVKLADTNGNTIILSSEQDTESPAQSTDEVTVTPPSKNVKEKKSSGTSASTKRKIITGVIIGVTVIVIGGTVIYLLANASTTDTSNGCNTSCDEWCSDFCSDACNSTCQSTSDSAVDFCTDSCSNSISQSCNPTSIGSFTKSVSSAFIGPFGLMPVYIP